MEDTYTARTHVMTWHGTFTVTIPIRIAREMRLKKGDALELQIKRLHEGASKKIEVADEWEEQRGSTFSGPRMSLRP